MCDCGPIGKPIGVDDYGYKSISRESSEVAMNAIMNSNKYIWGKAIEELVLEANGRNVFLNVVLLKLNP